MKTKVLRNLFVIVISLFYTFSFSQENFTKNYEKSYDLNKNSFFKISNKYGKVHIENTNTNKLEILVTISVETKNKDKADKVFDKIKINFNQSGDVITAETEIEKDIKIRKFSIDYNIKMPEDLKIDLTNKYGDIFINKLKSKSTITCKYGNLKINELLTSELANLATVNIKYSSGDINKCDYLNLNVKYSEMEIGESRAVYVNSGYSKLEFDKAYILKVVSKYDPTFEIGEVTKIELEGKYSDYEIGEIYNALKADISYSNFELDHLNKSFENVDIASKYGNVEINVDEEASYKFSGEVEYGSISSRVKNEKSDEGIRNVSNGFVGNDKKSKSKITIVSKYGNIEVE